MDKAKEQILKKHVGMIHCEGKLSLVQRKICNILIFNALNTIEEEEIFHINFKSLCSMIGYKSNDIELIKSALKQLMSLVLEWNLLQKDKKAIAQIVDKPKKKDLDFSWHASSLLAGVSIEGGVISYSYSPQIKKVISSLDIYGQINLFVQAKLKSSYSLALYENCVRFKSIKQTCWFDIKTIRSLLGVEKNKYQEFKYLMRSVIQPAIKEINKKSDITIEVEFRKAGKSVQAMKFNISDNAAYIPKLRRKEKPASSSRQELKNLLMSSFKLSSTQSNNIIEEFNNKYVREKLDILVNTQAYKEGKIANTYLYLKTILKKDYISAIQPEMANENKHISSTKEVFFKEYANYKISLMLEVLNQLEPQKKKNILDVFENNLSKNSPILLKFFKRNKLNSPFISADFLKFIEVNYSELTPEFLTYEEFITNEKID